MKPHSMALVKLITFRKHRFQYPVAFLDRFQCNIHTIIYRNILVRIMHITNWLTV